MPPEAEDQDTVTSAGKENEGKPEEPTKAEGKTFTQAELNTLLAAERKKTADKLKTEQETKQAEEQGNYQKLLEQEKARAAKLEQELADEKLTRLRTQVAAKHKLSEEQAGFLTGSDEDELIANAKKLIKAFGISQDKEQKDDTYEGSPVGSKESRKRVDRADEQYAALQNDPLYSM